MPLISASWVITLLIVSVVTEQNLRNRVIDKSGFTYLGLLSENVRLRRSTIGLVGRGGENVYYVGGIPSSWGEAWLSCRRSLNGELLTIETEEKEKFIRDLMITNKIIRVWTSGAFDYDSGDWRWIPSGSRIGYFNWLPNQPESCDRTTRILFNTALFTYGWSTENEDILEHFVCEVRS